MKIKAKDWLNMTLKEKLICLRVAATKARLK